MKGLESVADYGIKVTSFARASAKENHGEPIPESRAAAAESGSSRLDPGVRRARDRWYRRAAGACCLVPFVLVSIGLGGAWLASFQLLEPYRPLFIGIALVALGFAWKRLYRPAIVCEPGTVCAAPHVQRGYKIGIWIVGAMLLRTVTIPYYASLLY